MMELKIAVIDDLKQDIDNVIALTERFFCDKETSADVTSFSSGSSFFSSFAKGDFHIVFLDICMDEMNGIELSRRLRAVDDDIAIVFMSTTTEFVFETFRATPFGYLVKPYSYESFCEVMERAVKHFSKRSRSIDVRIPRSVIFETIVNAVAHRDYNSTGSVQVSVFRNRIVVRNPGTLPVELTKADLMKEHGSYPHNPYLAEVMYQMGYIEKYGTGITENIRRMQEARLLAPEIDLSAEFVTTIWRDNIGTNVATNVGTNDTTNIDANKLIDNTTNGINIGTNIGTSGDNVATDHLVENKRIVDRLVKKKVKLRMTKEQLRECIIEVCIVDHSIDELATLLRKSPDYLQNSIIPDLVADGILLRTKPSHSPGQTYMTNPKLDI